VFGIGWLIGSSLPASTKEVQAAASVKQAAPTLAEPLKDAVREAADDLKLTAHDAVAAVQDRAKDAAETLKEEGISSAQDIKEQARDGTQAVQDSRLS
jgi:gas vesicle protein